MPASDLVEPPTTTVEARSDVSAETGRIETLDAQRPSARVLVLEGTVTVVDSADRPLQSVDGTLRWTLFRPAKEDRPAASQELEVQVRAGAWKAELDAAAGFEQAYLRALHAGPAWLAVLSPLDAIALPAGEPIPVRARQPQDVVLRVRDALSGLELAAVDVVAAAPFPHERLEHPGADFAARLVRAGVPSPIRLDAAVSARFEGRIEHLLVAAEGFAWSRVPVDFSQGGERAVALEPGGALEVDVSGADPTRGITLRARSGEGAFPFATAPLPGDGRIVWRGLPQRRFRVSAELGEWHQSPAVLAEASVDVHAGATARVTLQIAPATDAQPASAAGVVIVPGAWGLEQARVTLALLDPPSGGLEAFAARTVDAQSAASAGSEAFRWSFEGMQSGRYVLALLEPPASMLVELQPGVNDGLTLRVPPPADVRVRVLDAASGSVLGDVQLRWSPVQDETWPAGAWRSARFDPESGDHLVRAPACALDVEVDDPRYQAARTRVDASKGERRATLRLELACGLVLWLRDGQTALLFPAGWVAAPEPIEGTQGSPSEWSFGALEQRISVTKPGTYSVLPPKLDGYLQPPAQRIEVRAGEFTRHVIGLEREHP